MLTQKLFVPGNSKYINDFLIKSIFTSEPHYYKSGVADSCIICIILTLVLYVVVLHKYWNVNSCVSAKYTIENISEFKTLLK